MSTDAYSELQAVVAELQDAKGSAFGILTADENSDVPVTGYPAQPSLAKRFKQAFDVVADATTRADLANATDPAKGAGLVGYKGRTQADRNADFVSVFDYMTAEQVASVKARDYLVDVTVPVNLCLSENPNVALPNGGYSVSHLDIPATLVHLYGAGKNGVTFRHAPGATGALWRWAGVRVMNSRFVGINLEGNGEAGETYGFDITGFSYCEFASCRARLFKLDGWFTDGAIVPVNKQNSNNTFVGCTGNNNQRDGIRLTGTVPVRYENTCNTFIGCEFAGNGGRGVNGEVCESSQWLGCTAQGNTGRDVYFNSRFSVFTGYLEGAGKAVELGALSYGCKVEIRSGYPLWNTFIDNGKSNTCSVMGECQPATPVFVNPFFTDWVGTTPAGVALNGSPALASYVDSGSPFGAGIQLTVGANFQGLIFSMSQPASALAGQWVTLLLEIETSGVADPLQMRVYARDGSTNNSTNGQFALEAVPLTASGVYKCMAYDVKFPDVIAGTPTVLWYAAYSGVSAGGNIIKIRSARIVLGQTREATLFSGDPHKPVSASRGQLSLASAGINVHRKFTGKQVYDTTAGKLRFAVSNSPTSAWRATDGTGDLTPV